MLGFLAQTDFTTTTTVVETEPSGVMALFSGVFLLVWLVVAVVVIAGMWKIFEKAGKPGWAAIVPIYNSWVLAEICGKPGWWGLFPILSVIPFLGYIAVIIISIYFAILLAQAFGKEPVWAVLLVLLPIVAYPMLGFGDAKYVGVPAGGGMAPPAPPADTPPPPPADTAAPQQ